MRTIDPRLQRFRAAYVAMVRTAHYRPQAPEDGFGNILLTQAELDDQSRLEAEAAAYAIRFLREEDSGAWHLGYSDFSTNRAFMWAIEAARQLATGISGRTTALKLLQMAATEIARVMKDERR
jgi:hypothetical protein